MLRIIGCIGVVLLGLLLCVGVHVAAVMLAMPTKPRSEPDGSHPHTEKSISHKFISDLPQNYLSLREMNLK